MEARTNRLKSKELIIIILFWMLLATLASLNRYLDPRGFGFRGITHIGPLAFPFIEAAIWAALTPLIFLLSGWAIAEKPRLYWQVPLLLAAGVAIAVGVDLLLDYLRFEFFAVRRRGASFAPLRTIGRFRFLNQFLVYLAVFAAGLAREYFLRERRRAAEGIELKAQLAEARVAALRMQINPHFLFNTLHAISALVERDPAGVRRMIARLSELLRRTLDEPRQFVTLREELQFIDSYLDIMRTRFQGRLTVSVEVSPDAAEAQVPAFVLQPVVENALEHGIAAVEGQGNLAIEAHVERGDLVVEVRDNGPGMRSGTEGVGLRNTRERLAQIYGGEGELAIASADEGTVARFTIPLRHAR